MPPVGGDRLRIYEIAKELSKEYQVDLLSLADSEEVKAYGDSLETPFTNIFLVKRRLISSVLYCLLSLFSKLPLQAAYFFSFRMKARLDSVSDDYNVIVFHLIRMGPYIDGSISDKSVVEFTDAISMNYSRINFQDGLSVRKLIYFFERIKLKKYEISLANRVGASVFISAVDRLFLGLQQSASVISNGVTLDGRRQQCARADGSVFIFIGNMESQQNLDAALFFAETILPSINEQYGSYSFRVVGRIRPRDAALLESFENVDCTGEVLCLEESLTDAFAGVCPVKMAAGVQNKILDYMSFGLPVITSGAGKEGLFEEVDDSLVIAETTSDYIDAVSFLREPLNHLAVGGRGRKYVERNHDWSAVMREYRRLVGHL